MTSAFIASLKATPKRTPATTVRTHDRGLT
jgi:hypothetical protein